MNDFGCGCYYVPSIELGQRPDQSIRLTAMWLPQIRLEAHATIVSTTSRTVLKQTFKNGSQAIREAVYAFPVYDGVSVIGFTCRVGDRVLRGFVKEKEKAREIYTEAIDDGKAAGLLEQVPNASDVFQSRVGNVQPHDNIEIEITYLGELKHDAEVNGIRWTLPSRISLRYGSSPLMGFDKWLLEDEGQLNVMVDVILNQNQPIRGMQSPSHPIAVTLGGVTHGGTKEFRANEASTTLAQALADKGDDFVLLVLADNLAVPQALLETHPFIPNQRAIMVSFQPDLKLKPSKSEIVFVLDRSVSMSGDAIITLCSAMQISLKSLPIGIKFNICSFGSGHSFMWPKSRACSAEAIKSALEYIQNVQADMGGTETQSAVKAVIDARLKSIPLEVIVMTDGDIWNQSAFFDMINEEREKAQSPLRLFSLGIGFHVSHAFIEGMARAGKGLAQTVLPIENFNSKVMRMLKAALSPHVQNYNLEITYHDADEDDFVIIESLTESMQNLLKSPGRIEENMELDHAKEPDNHNAVQPSSVGSMEIQTRVPKLIQAPSEVAGFYSFSRISLYILISPEASIKAAKSVVISGSSPEGSIRIEIPIQNLEDPNTTIHQLAAKRAMLELEEGRGWIMQARDETGDFLKNRDENVVKSLREHEAMRLGVQFQVAGRFCSFVGVESIEKRRTNEELTFEDLMVDDEDLITGEAESPAGSHKHNTRSRTNAEKKQKLPQKQDPMQPNGDNTAVMLTWTSTKSISGDLGNRKEMYLKGGAGLGLGMGGAKRHRRILNCGWSTRQATRTKQTARKSTSSKASRKAVSSKAARKAGDSLSISDTTSECPAWEQPVDLKAIIQLQAFDGFWKLDKTLLKIVKVNMKAANAFLSEANLKPSRGVSSDILHKVLASVFAISYLRKHLADEKEVWELVVDKAEGWLRRVLRRGVLKKFEKAYDMV